MKMLLSLLLAFSCLASTGFAQTSMLDMRKKIQKSKVQQTKTYVQAVDDALAQNDIPAAERALTAAIAQGTLTQPQINEVRGSIQSRSSSMSAARSAQEQAKREQEQATASTTSESSSRSSSGTGSSSGGGFQYVTVHFTSYGSWYQAARVFNVNASGSKTSANAASPGTCKDSLNLGRTDTTPNHDCTISGNATAGIYGYEVTMADVDKNMAPGDADVVKWSGSYSGTFTVPQGCRRVIISRRSGSFEIQYLN